MLYQSRSSHGGDIYQERVRLDFSVNTNPCGVPEGVREAVCRAAQQLEHYPDPGCRELVRAISDKEQVPEDQILCGNGAAELIYSYCSAIKPGKALETAPAFSEYAMACEPGGCEMIRYPLRKENGFLLDEGILDLIRSRMPDVVFLCNPNNPDGRIIRDPLMQEILALCSVHGIRLFADECFLDLSCGGVSLKGSLQDHPELFILKAFTKNYAMAGIRLGYALSSDKELLRKMARQVQPWNVSVPAQAAGIAALKETGIIDRALQLIRTEKPFLIRGLTEMGCRVYPSEANYLLFEGPVNLAEVLSDHGILIRSCRDYQGLGPGWFRISVRPHPENQQLLDTIRSVSKEFVWQEIS